MGMWIIYCFHAPESAVVSPDSGPSRCWSVASEVYRDAASLSEDGNILT